MEKKQNKICKPIDKIKEIKKLSNQVYAIVGKTENTEFPKLSFTQLLILDYLLEHQEKWTYQKDLEDVLNLTRATVSSVLITLEKYNILKRSIDKEDTRTKKIILTKKTKDYYEYGTQKMKHLEEIVTKGIDKKELDKFFQIIETMQSNIERTLKCLN